MKTYVCQGATIGANATIVCGNKIGKFSLVGAGAVITKDVPDYAIMVGNPAKQIGWISEYGEKIKIDPSGLGFCKKSGQKFKLVNDSLVRIE